jgi:(p)ppGpp synthase/HD superfamily hydrolase
MTSLLADAIALAAEAHRGQVDKAGEPYALHPIRVMLRVREQGHRLEVQAAAVLHDTLEDTPTKLEDLTTLSPDVAALVNAVTRQPGEPYEAFIRRAGEQPEARAIKVADIEDNLSRIDRLAQLSPERAARLERRYRSALAVLLA